MRILIIHNYYQHPGGEDVVFEQEKAMLTTQADVFSLTFKNRKGWLGAWQTLWSPFNIWAGKRIKRAIGKYRPDIIHIHNLHYAIGPIAVRIARRRSVPVVMTLHNYRLLCPSATLFYRGQLFTDSLQAGFPWRAVRLGVHAHSSLKTCWLALTNWLHKKLGTWQMVDRYITLTDFARQLFINSTLGIPAEKFVNKPNFVLDNPQVSQSRGNHFLFIGRLTEEKGLDVLLAAFEGTDHQLRIAGDGPLLDKVTEACRKHPNIAYLGSLGRAAVEQQLATCTALIFPSIWFEGMPMTIIEAFAFGTPVIASDLGAMQTMVQDGINGWRFKAGDASDLCRKAGQWLMTDDILRQHIGRQTRTVYDQHYTPDRNRSLLLNIYHSVKNTTR